MKKRVLLMILMSGLAATLSPGAFAANAVLSGIFDGSEAKLAPLPGTCGGDEALGYQETGPFQVSATGVYTILDAYYEIGVSVSALIYENSFDPQSPLANLVTPEGIGIVGTVNLAAGVNYVLVVQQFCTNQGRQWINPEGNWAVAFSGPGEVSSDDSSILPQLTQGSFTNGDPVADTDCGNSQYRESGPVRVSRAGTYYYTDLTLFYDVDACLQIYTAPFDPANPNANRVGLLDDVNTVELEAGKDYYFVVQPYLEATTGEYFFVFVPEAPFRIGYAMSGSWYFPPTTGQGFLMDVFDSANLLFLAWFTYDLERPAEDVSAQIGDPGHRWMTAVGPFQGNTANLNITWSSGMILDSETPPVSNETDGTMTVEFSDCKTGNVSYNLGASGRSGEIPIERIVNDAVPFCQTMSRNPDRPGPL
ncbi:MAG: hypothetical protein HKN57_13715 [Xanthomonadales bacterium]|nr:hypothetical protein [Gammaproteobacteria bacterium]MBT8053957.1 hypothetical protein [Gammaproteobacteria bacterium]NND58298.1 hypothetical protein [Xanthomonadales bacterium]NNK51991.1 hypothetical protein [Xanthomonadales bacterium]